MHNLKRSKCIDLIYRSHSNGAIHRKVGNFPNGEFTGFAYYGRLIRYKYNTCILCLLRITCKLSFILLILFTSMSKSLFYLSVLYDHLTPKCGCLLLCSCRNRNKLNCILCFFAQFGFYSTLLEQNKRIVRRCQEIIFFVSYNCMNVIRLVIYTYIIDLKETNIIFVKSKCFRYASQIKISTCKHVSGF